LWFEGRKFCHREDGPQSNRDISFFFYCFAEWGYMWHLQMFLQYIKYITLEFTPFYHCSLFLPPAIPGIVSVGIIFAFTYKCTQYLYHIHPPTHFPHFLPLPTGINPPWQDLPKERFLNWTPIFYSTMNSRCS
jgi:hypothetical protein